MIKTCSELRDNDRVLHQNVFISWAQFKNQVITKKWIFDPQIEQTLLLEREKNVKIWNYFGKGICKAYKDRSGIKIDFIKADYKTYQKIHYILLLDRSSSMQG